MLQATPEELSGGTLNTKLTSPNYFGEMPINFTGLATNPNGGSVRLPLVASQSATGIGFSAKYTLDWFNADIGTSPVGFKRSEIVGGVGFTPSITSNLRLDLYGERRAVTDSVLSYAGTTDPVTGTQWGGVYTTHGHAALELTEGLTNFYIGGGYAVLHGQGVMRNSENEAGAGGSTQVAHWSDSKLNAGLDLVYFSYAHNLRYFTLGQGGYFSPQSFFAALVPITYEAKPSDSLTWKIGGTVGFQTYTESNSDLFPTSPGLQGQVNSLFTTLAANQTTNIPYFYPFYPGSQKAGIAGGLNGQVEYKVSRNFVLGAKASVQHFANWDEGIGQLYARFIFMDAR